MIYRKLYDYTGQVTYVLGEFYWRLTRNQRTANTDYAGTGTAARKRLTASDRGRGHARRWCGRRARRSPPTRCVAAFRLGDDKRGAVQRDAAADQLRPARRGSPRSSSGASSLFVVLLLFRCGDDHGKQDCSQVRSTFGEASQEYQSCLNSQRSGGGYRSGGGSFGGFSSGGGHK